MTVFLVFAGIIRHSGFPRVCPAKTIGNPDATILLCAVFAEEGAAPLLPLPLRDRESGPVVVQCQSCHHIWLLRDTPRAQRQHEDLALDHGPLELSKAASMLRVRSLSYPGTDGPEANESEAAHQEKMKSDHAGLT